MLTRQTRLVRSAACCGLLGLAALAVGCSSGVAHPVEPGPALTALRTTLDAWKAGRSPDSLKEASPPIVAQDLEWLSGAKLEGYQIEGEGVPADANLDVRVRLSLVAKGKKVERDARYLVTTSPALTVFRDMMR